MKYGNRIKILRETLRMTQKELAERLEISQSYLCSIESGKLQANAKVLFGLAKMFGVRMLWLEEGIGEMFSGQFNNFGTFVREKENISGLSCLPRILSLVEVGKLIVCKVVSDNMEPLLAAGDEVLVDVTENQVENFGVYLFEIESERVFKRFVNGAIMKLTNDKPAQKNNDLVFNGSTKCVGKVTWIIRKLQ